MITLIYEDFDIHSYYRMQDVLHDITDLLPETTMIRSLRWSESVRRFLLLWEQPIPMRLPAILVESGDKSTLIYPADFDDVQIEAIILEFFKDG